MKSVITCDLDGKVETFSDGAETLFGYNREEVVNKMEQINPSKIPINTIGMETPGRAFGYLVEISKRFISE